MRKSFAPLVGLVVRLASAGEPLTHETPGGTPSAATATTESLETLPTYELLERVENLSQICLNDNGQRTLTKFIQARSNRLGAELAARAKAAGIEVSDADPAWTGPKWDAAAWKTSLRALPDEARCEKIQLAYAVAVWRLSTLPPTEPICSKEDIFCAKRNDETLVKDQRRAIWELRYMHSLTQDLVPTRDFPHCQARTLVKSAQARYRFVFERDRGLLRYPLGTAIGMCGRPLNSHYIDGHKSLSKPAESARPIQERFQDKTRDDVIEIEEGN